MEPLSRIRLLVLAAIMGVVAWGVSRTAVNSGASPLSVPWTVLAIAVAVGVVVVWLGWTVRQYRRGKNPGLSGLRAARTAVFAQAAAYTGAIITGAFGGYGLAIAVEWSHSPRREVAISAFIAAVGGIVLVVAALLAEHWCKDDSSDDNEGGKAPA
ncbi:DUF3180 domain-containing protein [Demequina sp. SYSU T00192]|uniref:DUF3180 domain-containing protein n=1 Tax=Demequina litoralis TaxID=3051660 RepID=A0ABT8G8K7_9MICO|nr:DUF3180 domain-containing protein [Demequina sp. SYSU T00192]MDN4475458.1 DUF3180 domain-containing protein [Demequina sp. SYSU T00192]